MSKHLKDKICYICYRRFPDTVFEHFSKAVSDNGYDVTISAFLEPGQQLSEIRDGRKINRFPLPGCPKRRKSALVFVLKVVKFLNKHHFSIVHIDHACPYFSLIKILTSNNAKFVYHTTSYPISTSDFKTHKKMVKNFIQCLFMDKIIVQSEELRKKLIGIRSLKRTKVVPVGFSGKLFYPIEETNKCYWRAYFGIPRSSSLLVYCGVISKLRELDRLLEAFKKVHATDENVIMVMVGDGDAISELRRLAKILRIHNNVIFTGRVKHDEVRNLIGAADIGMSYVPINENYNYNPPLKTFEYLACGLPTIATRTLSNSKIIKSGFNGVLVNDRPEDLGRAIISLLKDKQKLDLLKKNARGSILEFDFDRISKSSLIPMYESVLNG